MTRRLARQGERRLDVLVGAIVTGLARRDRYLVASTADGTEHTGRAVIVATGCSYPWLDVTGERDLMGRGLYFGATGYDPNNREGGDEVMVVGGSESGTQASLFLTRQTPWCPWWSRH